MRASELLALIRGKQASPERDAVIIRAALDGSLVPWPWVQVPLDNGRGYFEVSADYVSIGEGADWVRVPLGGAGYQLICEQVGSVLPTSYMVELAWRAAPVKLDPLPFKDLTGMMMTERFAEHHAWIEKQRAGRGGLTPQQLISGHKKDLVVSNKLAEYPGAVCIFGWYKPDGGFIQPTSTRHKEYWYSDYSHGGRLVRPEMVLDGQRELVENVLRDPRRAAVLTGGDRFAAKSQGPDQVLRVTRYQVPDELRKLVGRVASSPAGPTASPAGSPAADGRSLGERAADVCLAELRAGVSEQPPGSNTGPRIREYLAPGVRRDTNKPLNLTEGDWCAAAQCFAATAAARPGDVIPHGYRVSVIELVQDAQASGAWRSAEELRAGRYVLRRGDLVCFRRPSAQTWTGHVVRADAPPDAAGSFWALSANHGSTWARVTYSLKDANLQGAIAYPSTGGAGVQPPAPVVATPAPAGWAWAPARPEPRGNPPNTILSVPGMPRLSDAARRLLLDLCEELGMPVDSLAAVMASESGLRSWVINGVQADNDGRALRGADGKYLLTKANQARVAEGKPPFFAVGLIQLTLGAQLPGFTTNDRLLAVAEWPAERQIQEVVRPYYQRMGSAVRGADPGKVYMLNFLPKFANSPPDTVIGDRASADSFTRAVYVQNAGFDTNGDGKVTVGDVHQAVARQVRASGGARVSVPSATAPAPAPPRAQPATVPASSSSSSSTSAQDRAWFVQSPGARALIRSTSPRPAEQGTAALVMSARRKAVIANTQPTVAAGWGSASDLEAYMTALKNAVDALYILIMGDFQHGSTVWKSQFTNWAHLYYSWHQSHGGWWDRLKDETWQTATSFHMRYLEWRAAAKEQGFNTASLGPEPDPQKAKELEEALKKGGESEWADTAKVALAAATGIGLLFGTGYVISSARRR